MRHINRLRLMRQGFTALSDEQLETLGPWLRLAPTLCAVAALTGTALASWLVLWSLVPVGAFAAATGKHPFDLIYDKWIRLLMGREDELPEYGAPRRFAAGMASAGFLSAGLAFLLGHQAVGTAIGTFFGGAILLSATTDICLGCNLYHLLVPEHLLRRRATRLSVAMMLEKRRSITAPRQALQRRPQLRRTG
jgi:hypothetical protein